MPTSEAITSLTAEFFGRAIELLSLSLALGGVAAAATALIAAIACRALPLRPATRHLLWTAVLISFLSPPLWLVVGRGSQVHDGVWSSWRATTTATPVAVPAAPLAEAAPLASRVETSAPRRRADVAASTPVTRSPRSSAAEQSIEAPFGATVNLPVSKPSEPTPIASSPRADRPSFDATATMRRWWSEARAAFAAMPAPPWEVLLPGLVGTWLAGTALLLVAIGVRILRASSALRAARPADEAVRTLVREASRAVGLATPPATYLVDAPVSPMIRCGLRPSLLLPTGLWAELDDASRRAVLLHELAHLKRRDHWICWAELVVAACYWWHPIAWWARRRLRDEAETACDAWVTALLPKHRRAYAEALLAARCHVSAGQPRPLGAALIVPHLALSLHADDASSTRPRPLAGPRARGTHGLSRRITMVMTQHIAPRSSLVGVVGAALLGLMGTFVAPSLACPPEKKAAAVAAGGKANTTRAVVAPSASDPFFGEAPALEAMLERGATTTPSAPRAPVAPRAPIAPRPPMAISIPSVPAPPAPPMLPFAGQAAMAPRHDPVLTSLEALEARLRALEAQLEALDVRQGAAPNPAAGFSVPTPPPALPAPSRPRASAAAGDAEAAFAARAAIQAVAASGRATSRTYHLSPGRLQALVGLMAREDVPVCVKWDDSSIEVTALPDQQEVVAAFVRLIDPQGSSGGTAVADVHPEFANKQLALERAVAELRAASDEQRRAAEILRARAGQAQTEYRALQNRYAEIRQLREEIDARSREREGAERDAELEAEFEAELDELDSQLDALDLDAETAEDAADEADDAIEMFHEQIQELSRRLERAFAAPLQSASVR